MLNGKLLRGKMSDIHYGRSCRYIFIAFSFDGEGGFRLAELRVCPALI